MGYMQHPHICTLKNCVKVFFFHIADTSKYIYVGCENAAPYFLSLQL
jgi:hypothetical protein